MILDRVVAVHRLTKDSDNTNKESYQLHIPLQQIAIGIQPSSVEDTVMAGATFGQAYTAFTSYSGVLSGDKLVDTTTGEIFLVKGRSNWNTPGIAAHTELLLVKFEAAE